ncbi:hypothetical protein CKM354_000539000 [Cercospora kikuchii]|uniref:STB6-like N-terminal domain-containing protein n=1 Tax=Cercospora kikuchii TaxID=84275 RepID=A0A9P3CKI3_9PEZI|nr:uncharacterized protein CKM354_000539000 [Cercospora kikuchii]GIZ42110.1 hypothetical protein CKM354_000539000 [Cercospora kikuchii]
MTTKPNQEGVKHRPAPLLTSLSAATQDGTPTSPVPFTPTRLDRQDAKNGQQRFVLTDPVAFRYLEADLSTTLIERRTDLQGYECYIVEQWTTSRMHPTYMITTFTGDPTHVVKVGVLGLPVDESTWSPRLRVYFKALNQYHARRRETPLGILMVTSLAGFPSSLAVIPVPDGDVGKHRFDFFVNEDLKRLGCSGRVGLSLSQPAPSTVVKFHQLYRTSEKNDIYRSVIEIIKLCQTALTLFDKLEIDYADGLLCDVTERAIRDWWVEFGSDHYNIEPHDGILGPTTVAGLLGMFMGARNRLHAMGAPVPKDPFDVDAMKKAISAFQKQQRFPRTRRLDRRTMDRLHKATQKAADKVQWTMPRAVKSTVAELSGKGGDLIQDGIGRRDRAGIAEIETVDIDRFVQLVYSDRCKWLWLGKPLKKRKVSDEAERNIHDAQEQPGFSKSLVFKADEQGGFTWTAGRKSTVDGSEPRRRETELEQYGDSRVPSPIDEGDESDKDAKPSVFKRATSVKHDAKSGFSKVKDVVGFRSHKPKPSVDEPVPTSPADLKPSKRPSVGRSHTSPVSSPNSQHASEKDPSRNFSVNAAADQSSRLNVALKSEDPTGRNRSTSLLSGTQVASQESLRPPIYTTLSKTSTVGDSDRHMNRNNSSTTVDTADVPSVAGSVYNGVELNEALPTGPETAFDVSQLLQRTVSYSHYVTTELQTRSEYSYPRQMSFSLAEDSVLTWESVHGDDYEPFASPAAQMAEQQQMAKESKRLRALITVLQTQTVDWTQSQLTKMHKFLDQIDRDQEALDQMHMPRQQNVRELQTHTEGMLREEKDRLEEGNKEIETLVAKLEYEVDALKTKVEDVRVAVDDYEKGVVRIEERVGDLEKEAENSSGWACTVQ